MKKALNKYDKYLGFKTSLDGIKKVFRKSPFNVNTEYDVLNIENKFVGSGRWVLREITLKDSQRFDIVGDVLEANRKLLLKKSDLRMSTEAANMILQDNILI